MTTRQNPCEGVVVRVFAPGADPRPAALADLPGLVSVDDTVVWVDLCAYSHADLYAVAELLDLQPDAVRAALTPGTLSRLDLYDRHLFISTMVPCPGVRAADTGGHRLDLFVGRNVVVSAHARPLPFADRVQARAQHDSALLRRDAPYLLYIMLDELLAYHARLAQSVCRASVAAQERALRGTHDSVLTDLLRVRREVSRRAELAGTYSAVVASLSPPGSHWAAGVEVSMGIANVTARLTTLCDALETAREATDVAFDLYLTRDARGGRRAVTTYAVVWALGVPLALIAVLTLTIGVVDGAASRTWAALLVRILVRVLAVGVLVLVIVYRYGRRRTAFRARIRDDGRQACRALREHEG